MTPTCAPGRIIFIFILAAGIVIHFWWKGVLVSSLAVTIINVMILDGIIGASWKRKIFFLQYPFQSLEDMPNSDYLLSYMKGSIMEGIIREENEMIWQKVMSIICKVFFKCTIKSKFSECC